MPHAIRRIVLFALLSGLALSFTGCWGGNEGSGNDFLGIDLNEGVVMFWARDMTVADNAIFYRTPAVLAAEGTRCRVYRELGRIVSDNVVKAIAVAFDNVIFPAETRVFGNEPRPVAAGGAGDADGDAKVTILLLDIRDDYATTGFFIGGYFDPVNEFRQSQLDAVDGSARSNEREMIYLDVDPMPPGGAAGLRELARQFQHMIHFNASVRNKRAPDNTVLLDDAWLDEAMSEAAPAYCRYELEYERLFYFETYPWDSLTEWAGSFLDFSPAFMWGIYFKDRFDNNAVDNSVFRDMLQSGSAGIPSVDNALLSRGPGLDFTSTFRDWSVAAAVGNRPIFPGSPALSYASLTTTGGLFGGFAMPGLFNIGNFDNAALRVLGPFSVDYYSYSPSPGSDNTLTWTPADNALAATFFYFDGAAYSALVDVLPGVPTPFLGTGFLMVRNPSGGTGLGGGTVSYVPVRRGPAAPPAALRESARIAALAPAAAVSLRAPLCVEPFLVGETRKLLAKGATFPF